MNQADITLWNKQI